MFGETRRHREEREARQRDLYPELALSDISGVFEVDRLRREESRPLTSVGMAVESAMVRSRPPVDPDEELAAPRGFFDALIRDPLPPPAPTPSVSPFRLAEQERFEEQQAIIQPTARMAAEQPLPGERALVAAKPPDLGELARRAFLSQAGGPTSVSELFEGLQLWENRLRNQSFGRIGLEDVGLDPETNPRIVNEVITALNPLNALIAGGGSGAAIALRGLAAKLGPKAARVVNVIAGAIEPFARRPALAFGFEAGAEVLALEGAAQAEERGAPLPVQLAAGLGAVVTGAGAVAGGRALVRQAPDIARAAGEIVQTARRPGQLLPGEATPLSEIVPGAGPEFPDQLRLPGEPPQPLVAPVPELPRGAAVPREAHVAVADPSPPPRVVEPPAAGEPPRRPPSARGTRGGGEPPDEILRRITEQRTLGERPDETLLRRHGGAIRASEAEARLIVDQGARTLRALDIGVRREGRLVPRTRDIPEMDELFKALHGEQPPAERMQGVYDELRQLTDWEQAARLDFDPEQAMVQDYFYRGWKPPEGLFVTGAGGRITPNPAFRKPRVGATYSEMREAGFEPLFWNPYEQFRVSRLQGVRYRQQMALLEDLKKLEIARPNTGGATPAGWRTPQVGPAFEGKPFATVDEAGESQVMFTRRWITDDRTANALEGLYGKRPDMGTIHVGSRAIVVRAIVDEATFTPKRAKLFLSLFQQFDFAARTGVGGWSGALDRLIAGEPLEAVKDIIRIPRTWKDMAFANLSPGRRTQWREMSRNATPFFSERSGIHFQGIGQAGLSQMDVTILNADIDGVMREVVEEALALKVAKAPLRAIRAVEGMTRRGLFEGIYPAAIMNDVRYNIAPAMLRSFPDLSDEAINGMIARAANIRWSTIPAEQSAIQMRALRETLRHVMFSFGEAEGLLRQATRAVPFKLTAKAPFVGRRAGISGTESRFWVKHWLGAYLFLTTTASLIHFASTGEALPRDRWSPISKDGWGPLPYGYNRDFASPDLPTRGRGGVKLAVDIVQQLDTVFRVLDPWSFISSRESVPVRALQNQLLGEDFYGRPIDTVGPEGVVSRTQQLIDDLFRPIGAGNLLEIARQIVPGVAQVVPESEGRLGVTGSAIQATGTNVRAETTPQLLDRKAQEFAAANGIEDVSGWDDLEPSQRKQLQDEDPELVTELELRRETGALRGSEGAQRGILADDVREEFRTEQLNDDALLERGEITHRQWRDRESTRNAQIRAALDVVFRDLPDREPETLLQQFGAAIDAATDTSGQPDWDEVAVWRAGLEDEENAELDRNLGLNSTETQKERRRVAGDLGAAQFFDIRDRVWATIIAQDPSLEQFQTVDDLEAAIRGRLEQRGLPPNSADSKIVLSKVMDEIPAVQLWRQLSNDVEEAWITANPSLARQAFEWDYLRTLRKDEEQVILAAATP